MDPATGRCAILFPHGVLFRDEEREMRRKIIAADVVEAVIGLGPNLFYNSPMEACIVVCRSRKPPERAGKVLLIDAVREVTRERAQSFLTPDHITRIVGAYRAYRDQEGFAAVVTKEEVAERDDNLSIPLYVRRSNGPEQKDFSQVIDAWRQSAADLRVAADELFDLRGSEDIS